MNYLVTIKCRLLIKASNWLVYCFLDKGDRWRRKIPTWGQGSDNDYDEKHCMELRLLQINCVFAQRVQDTKLVLYPIAGCQASPI